jgi:hypothetical protein
VTSKAANLGVGVKAKRYGLSRFATSSGLSFEIRLWRAFIFIDAGFTRRDTLAAAAEKEATATADSS